MSEIESIRARQILDSRGNPTVEVELLTASGVVSRAAVPSGASTGEHEAYELRDEDKLVYCGKGVLKAVSNIEEIIGPKLEGEFDVSDQIAIDNFLIALDGTPNKSKLGANAILAVSMACAKAAAEESELPLYRYLGGSYACRMPVPLLNVINGGAHANNKLDFQEFMIVPHGFSNFSDSLRAGVEIFHALKKVLSEKKLSTSVGDEGGFAPQISTSEEALELLTLAVQKSGYELKTQISFALDVAASSFFKDGKYHLDGEGTKKTSQEMIDIYINLMQKFPIVSIEDGLDENDWNGWKIFTEKCGSKIQIVGDDIFVTNPKLLSKGIKEKVANSILIKLNQIGTVSQTLKAIELAKISGYAPIISHRSGETEDTFIADLAVATNSGQIKTGSASRSDRIAKYNQLIRIEEELGKNSKFKFNPGCRH